jgi:hypothetical protein
MTYEELLKETEIKKQKAIKDINKALKGNAGFLAEAEIKRNPGMVAWLWLAKDFCETLADNFPEIYDSADESTQRELSDIYMAYEDGSPYLYELLPYEAQLFEA